MWLEMVPQGAGQRGIRPSRLSPPWARPTASSRLCGKGHAFLLGSLVYRGPRVCTSWCWPVSAAGHSSNSCRLQQISSILQRGLGHRSSRGAGC